MKTEEKKLKKVFWKYVSLNIMSMLGLSCFIFVDTLCIATGVGSNGLAALNLSLPVYLVLNGVGLMIGIGGATSFSMKMGTGNIEGARKSFTHSVRVALFFGILFTIVGLVGVRFLGRILGADETIIESFVPYLKTLLLFSIAFLMNNVLVCFVRNDSNPQIAMAAMLTGSFSNILLDILFVFGFKWGMFGAAFATGISPLLSMCVLSLHFFKGKCHFKIVKATISIRESLKLMSLGAASFITEFSSGIVMMLFNFTILGIAGSVGIAAYGVVANLALIVIAIFTGIAQGMQPMISSFHGKKDQASVCYVLRTGLILSAAIGIFCFLAGTFLTEPLIRIFNESASKEFHDIAMEGIRIYFVAFIPAGMSIVTASACAAIDKAVPSMVIALARGVIFNVILVFILPKLFHMTGVWAVVPMAEAITVVIAFFILFKLKLFRKTIVRGI